MGTGGSGGCGLDEWGHGLSKGGRGLSKGLGK